ncbi:TrlF family AAA-like ATPase [Bacillus sp. EB01]|uniref:TrlF family AAA-like ATPase n=1 Tax=Bacillus sp. EB01 TaxID=1347086 RepID=UPI0005C4C036|nr:PHP domain-containing protein [Bacillus sp. EB01]
MNFRGNQWYKCDLHLHTPESKCFSSKEVTPEEWVQSCIAKGLEVVAVTDHNSGNYIDRIIEAAKGTKLTVFPGVEITCDTSKVHLLILFDIDKRTSDINGFLHYCGIQDHKFAEQDATTEETETIFSIAEKAVSRGAVVIPAHIDEYNGICETSYQTMQNFMDKPYITGVQVVNREIYYQESFSSQERLDALIERYPRINEDLVRKWSNAVKLAKKRDKAMLTFSDNPSAHGKTTHGLWGIGNRYTWIKMEEDISLESLRHALLMPSQKIRNDFDCPSSPYTKPNLLIKGLVVKNTVLNPRDTIKIQLSPQLNTIIGGRGTGKSAIHRIIRGLLENNSDISDFGELLQEQKNFFKQCDTRSEEEKKGILTNDTVIELYIERLGHTYKIIYTNFHGEQFSKTFYKMNENGIYQETPDPILDLFSAEIYSQKQIYQIATRPNALREKIDQSIINLDDKLKELKDTQNTYFVTSVQIRSIRDRIRKKSRLEFEIKDVQERLLEFKEKGYQNILKKQQEFEADNANLQKVTKDFEDKESKLSDMIDTFCYPDFDKFEFLQDGEEELRMILARNSTEFHAVITKLTDSRKVLTEAKASLIQAIRESTWNQHFQKAIFEFQTLQDELTPDELKDLDNIEALSTELNRKGTELEDIAKDEDKLNTLSDELKGISDSYLEIRKHITTLRRDFLGSVLADTPNIKIEVKPFRDSENFEAELRKILQRPDTFTDDFQVINSLVFNGPVERNITELRDMITTIKDTGQNNGRFTGRFNTLIKGLNDEQMDKIRLLYPEDKIEVQYKANAASGFKSISNASAGQKTSAILTFLLSYGDSPLLLDQPEDDLDNQLIYELIVDRLCHSKNTRQIIAVTHNANIPVNGDSEWVIAMNSESKNIEVLCEGSIEKQGIKEAICNIMEGGKEAFTLRAKRYKLEV